MKYLIVTRADNNIEYYSPYTHFLLNKYAEKCNADFKIIDGDPVIWTKETPPRPHFRIAELYKLHEEYDRILCIDSDVIINKDCPNIFEVVPEDCIGTVLEDVGTNRECCLEKIENIQKEWGNINWKDKYVNTGVFVTSKMHRDIFNSFNGKWWITDGYDDIHIGYNINRLKFKLYELSYKWNHMSMFSKPWNGSPNKFNSYIIHYAGGHAAKVPIPDDIARIYGIHAPHKI